MRQHVVYILDLFMTLTFDLYVGSGSIPSGFYSYLVEEYLFCQWRGSGYDREIHWLLLYFIVFRTSEPVSTILSYFFTKLCWAKRKKYKPYDHIHSEMGLQNEFKLLPLGLFVCLFFILFFLLNQSTGTIALYKLLFLSVEQEGPRVSGLCIVFLSNV